MARIDDINLHLQGTKRGQDTAGTDQKINEINKSVKAANGTTLGDSDGQIVDGIFRSLVQVKNSNAEIGTTSVKPVLTTIVKELPSIEDKMKPNISASDLTELNKIFGNDAVTITAAPETVTTNNTTNMNLKLFTDGGSKSVMEIITVSSGVEASEIQEIVKKLVEEDLQELMPKAIEIIKSDEVSDLMTGVFDEVEAKFKTLNGGISSGNFMKDLSENFSGELNTLISGFGDEFTSGKTLGVINAALGKLNPLDLTASITNISSALLSKAGILGIGTNIGSLFDMQGFIGKMELQAPELQAELTALGAKIDKQINGLGSAKTTVAATVNDSNTARHQIRNAETSVKENQFTLLGSQEEIESILKTAERDITTIVWHWTGHYSNDGHISAADINQEFSANGESIPYHFIIRKDGSIQTGAALNIATSHVQDEFKPLSFGVAFVAGYNGSRGPNGFTGNAKLDVSSITQAQWKSFNTFMKAFYIIFPGGDAFGNNDLQIDEDIPAIDVGPGFDVSTKILASPFYRLNSGFPIEDRKFLTVDDIIAKDKASKDRQLEEQDIQ